MRKMIYIEWLDSFSHQQGGAWVDADKAHVENLKCRSLGFVVEEDDEKITIACHDTALGDCVSGNMTIPKRAITKRRLVTVKGVT